MKQKRKILPEHEREELVELASQQLWEKGAEKPLRYLTKDRNLKPKVIKDFKLGYIPYWVKNPDGLRHEFADRIVYPIYNQYNDVVALTSRSINPDCSHKFHHESYDKPFYLYGFNRAKKNILESNKVIIVEGQHDVMSAVQSGFLNTVGILGSAFSIHQLSLLLRYCREIYMCFDTDTAGQGNAKRMLDFYKKSRLDIYDCHLINIKLPDSKELNVDQKKIDVDFFINNFGAKKFLNILKKTRLNYFKEQIQ